MIIIALSNFSQKKLRKKYEVLKTINMPGGKGNIKPSDGKQFEKGNKAAEKWTEEEALKLGNDMLAWFREKDENIFFEDFLFLSCDESKYAGSIYKELPAYLSNKFTSFLNVLEKCRQIEKIKLKKFGAFDKLNASIVKFLLSAEYGLSEKKEIDNKSSDNSMSPQPTIEVVSAKTKKTLNDVITKLRDDSDEQGI